MSSTALAQLEVAKQALVHVQTVDEAKDLRDKAEAIRFYFSQQEHGREVAIIASEIKIRAERKLGELLRDKVKQGRPLKRSQDETFLPDGVTKMQSHRWQRIALLPEANFEGHIDERKKVGEEISTNGVLRLAAQAAKEEKKNGVTVHETSVVEQLEDLIREGKTFSCIYADPPWQYDNQSTRASTDNHYPTMTVEEICSMPVGQVLAENAHLHLWTTNAFLRDAFLVLEKWGFAYKGVFVWVKDQMGIGNYWRVSHEFLLLGVRGELTFADKKMKSWVKARRGKHSSKPEPVRGFIERATPGPYLELFGRKVVKGWTVLGNQIKDFATPLV